MIRFLKVVVVAIAIQLASCNVAPAQVPVGDNQYLVRVESVYDGDTFRVRFEGLPEELNPLKIRVRGVDSPERGSPKCQSEREGAERARRFAERTLGNEVILSDIEWDKYGGRILADVYVDGQNFSNMLIANGHGRPYNGGQRRGWC